MVPELVGIKRVPSQSVLSRFFQGFSSAGGNLRCFRRLFGWCLQRLPSRPGGYALDLDSTRLLHEDGLVLCSSLRRPSVHKPISEGL